MQVIVYIMYVYCLFIMYIYKYTHSVYILKIFTCVYIFVLYSNINIV